MELRTDAEFKKIFPEVLVQYTAINEVTVEKERTELENFKKEVIEGIKKDYTAEVLKDSPIIRLYRDFFWRAGIDPTKTRPASEALIRRILKNRPMPRINTLVDSYNLASMKTNMSLAAFDMGYIRGNLTMRFAISGETFLGIAMEKPIMLKGNEPIMCDEEKIIAVYPYRDSDSTKVTLNTKNTLLLVCGVPGIKKPIVDKTLSVATEYITRFCGGQG